MGWIFGLQIQTGRIGSTTFTTKPNCSLTMFSRKIINNGDRLTTTSPQQSISAQARMKLCRLGEGKHVVCTSRQEGCLHPPSRRSHASTTECRRRRLCFARQIDVSDACLVSCATTAVLLFSACYPCLLPPMTC